MITYNEIRELVLQGELEAAVNLLLAHRLVSSVEVQGDVTARLTPFGVQIVVTQPGCDRFLDISTNEDNSPVVDVFVEQLDLPYDAPEVISFYEEEVDSNTGKTAYDYPDNVPFIDQVEEEFEKMGFKVQQAYQVAEGLFFCIDNIYMFTDHRSSGQPAWEVAESLAEAYELEFPG